MRAALPAGMCAAAAVMLRSGDPASPAARQQAIEAATGIRRGRAGRRSEPVLRGVDRPRGLPH